MTKWMNAVWLAAVAGAGIGHAAEAEPVTITDFSICTPGAALATTPKWDHWQIIEYEADGVAGKMIGAKALIEPPAVTLPMTVKGWHKIYIGVWNPDFEYSEPAEDTFTMVLKLKLSGDPTFHRIQENNPGPPAEQVYPGRTSLIERFWRAEDLTGKNLTISKFKGAKTYLAYVKLIPMSPAEIAEEKTERAWWNQNRRLVASDDGTGFKKFLLSVPTEEDLRAWVEVYRYSTIARYMMAVSYGDWTNYRSKFGTLVTEIPTYGWMSNDSYARTIPIQKALLEKGIVFQDVIADHLHSMGIKFDIMLRPSIQRSPLEHMDGFFERHPELRMRHGDGSPIEKLSFAFPEVRNFHLSIMREAAERFDIDGVNMAFVRLNQAFGDSEQPLLDAFQDRYGDDPRTDAKMDKVKEGFFIQFMRDARNILDRIGRKKGKRLELSAWVWPWEGGGPTYSPIFNIDYRTMMKEKLLDSVIIHYGDEVNEKDLAIAHANGCKYFLRPGGGTPKALDGYAKGMDGMAEWDVEGRTEQYEYEWWRSFRVAGNAEKLRQTLATPSTRWIKLITVRIINGVSVSGEDLFQSSYGDFEITRRRKVK